jgi:hypothetical protein
VCAGSNPAEGAIQVASLPDDAAEVASALHHGLQGILRDDLASLFLYGAIAFPRPEGWRIDFDFHVLLHQPLDDTHRGAIRRLYADLANASELGGDLDGYYVLLGDASRREPPLHQLDLSMRDDAWALHRAHVLAGRAFVVAGIDPKDIVPEPTWAELEEALLDELRFVETHPTASAFGLLNGARILYSFATRDVVVSKYQAGQWGLESLPEQWRGGLRAALRYYERTSVEGDDRVLDASWGPFVSYVKGSILT